MVSKKPRVGIFMPAYNQGSYIDEAIESLKKQTFQDFEVAIVDDASTDEVTIPILKSIDYDKARVYFHDKNQGVGKLARGYYKKLANDYIFVLCADDKLHPKFIEECVAYLDRHPKEAAVATWIQNFGNETTIQKIDKKKLALPDMLFENRFLGSSMMRFEALKEIDFGNKEAVFQKHNDYDRWVSMLEKGWSLGVIDKPLFYYRRLKTSLSASINPLDEEKFRIAFYNKHAKLFEKYIKEISLRAMLESKKAASYVAEIEEANQWLKTNRAELLDNIAILKQNLKNQRVPFLSSIARVVRNQGRKPQKIVGVFAYRYDYKLVPSLIENIKPIVDDVIMHDDRENDALWYHEGEVRKSLIEKARRSGADWILCIDPDERFEHDAAEKIRILIEKARGRKIIYSFQFRNLWTPDKYRVDGMWGNRKKHVLFPLLPDQTFMNRRVHSVWHPQNDDYLIIDTDINLYHFKNIEPSARTARKNLYKEIDPNNIYQNIGYDFLDDETSLELEKIPKNRGYSPDYDPDIKIVQTDKTS